MRVELGNERRNARVGMFGSILFVGQVANWRFKLDPIARGEQRDQVGRQECRHFLKSENLFFEKRVENKIKKGLNKFLDFLNILIRTVV